MRAFAEGVLAGLGIAVPVGAIAVLIVDLGMRRGFVRAVPAAMGAASADFAYATVAAIAGVAVASAIGAYERGIELVSAAVLVAIVGFRLFVLFRRPEGHVKERAPERPLRTFAGFLALTLVNPLTVAYFAVLIVGLGDETLESGWDKALFVTGAFVASASWQLLLAGAGAMLHRRLSDRARVTTALLGNALIAALAVRLASGAWGPATSRQIDRYVEPERRRALDLRLDSRDLGQPSGAGHGRLVPPFSCRHRPDRLTRVAGRQDSGIG